MYAQSRQHRHDVQAHRADFFDEGLGAAGRAEHAGNQAEHADGCEVHDPRDQQHHAFVEAFEKPRRGQSLFAQARNRDAEGHRPDDQRQQVGFGSGADQVRRNHRQQDVLEAPLLCRADHVVGLFETGRRYPDAGLDQIHHEQADQHGNKHRDEIIGDRNGAEPAEVAYVAQRGHARDDGTDQQRDHQHRQCVQEQLAEPRNADGSLAPVPADEKASDDADQDKYQKAETVTFVHRLIQT